MTPSTTGIDTWYQARLSLTPDTHCCWHQVIQQLTHDINHDYWWQLMSSTTVTLHVTSNMSVTDSWYQSTIVTDIRYLVHTALTPDILHDCPWHLISSTTVIDRWHQTWMLLKADILHDWHWQLTSSIDSLLQLLSSMAVTDTWCHTRLLLTAYVNHDCYRQLISNTTISDRKCKSRLLLTADIKQDNWHQTWIMTVTDTWHRVRLSLTADI